MKIGEVVIRAYPRVHLGLVDLGFATQRAFGGVGFSVDALPTVVRLNAHRSSRTSLAVTGVVEPELSTLQEAIKASGLGDGYAIEVVIQSRPPRHSGLGSGTSLRLAVLTGLVAALDLDVSRHDLQVYSRRGGASGVGIHAFFEGGLVVDCGHPASDRATLVPSGASPHHGVPTLVARTAMPTSWGLSLILPGSAEESLSGSDEQNFFGAHTPVPRGEVLDALAALYHGLLPSAIECDFASFRSALIRFQSTGFKRREIDRFGTHVSTLLNRLNSNPNLAAGMSSMGPLVFVLNAPSHLPPEGDLLGRKLCYGIRVRNLGFELKASP